MSEKRFTLRTNSVSTNYPSGRIFDNKKQHSLYLDEIMDLLNELAEENEKLKDFIELMNMRQKWKLYNTRLSEG